MVHTFLWHDYETFGTQPKRDRPAQFAAIRTDAHLNILDEPMVWYCQPTPDFLPDPKACLITKITPQHCLAHGIPEYVFAQRINQALSTPYTIGVGYNTIRFDDEVTRFLLWRNLIDPYAREWQHHCGRWDILDMVRTTYALRPEGTHWPARDEGLVSFKLADLCAANDITHEHAHDALSDVYATIGLAKHIKTCHPKLFDFCLGLHKKERVIEEMGLPEKRPFLHISGMFSPLQGCLSVVWPLQIHPKNKNEVIVWDLAYDPRELSSLEATVIRERLFTKQDDVAPKKRLPIKTIHINRAPIVIRNLKTLTPALAERWHIDIDAIHKHIDYAQHLPDLSHIFEAVYERVYESMLDVDQSLYQGFVSAADRRRLDTFTQRVPQHNYRGLFDDTRLAELVFRYRARYFPDSLDHEEQIRWEAFRKNRLLTDTEQSFILPQYIAEIESLLKDASLEDSTLLHALKTYALSLFS